MRQIKKKLKQFLCPSYQNRGHSNTKQSLIIRRERTPRMGYIRRLTNIHFL